MAAVYGWTDLHESVLVHVLAASTPRARAAAAVACPRAAKAARAPASFFPAMRFQDGVGRARSRELIAMLSGAVEIELAGCAGRRGRAPRRQDWGQCGAQRPTPCSHHSSDAAAVAAESRARFRDRVHRNTPLRPPPPALAAALHGVTSLTLDERVSPLGGATDDLATELSRRGGAARLQSLALSFENYSAASSLFTDAGLAALAGSSGSTLRSLALGGASGVTDRGLARLGAACPRLACFAWTGYSELVSDYGIASLAAGAKGLRRVRLDARLPRVTDAGVAALAASAGPSLRFIALSGGCGDRALTALAAHCPGLESVDARACARATRAGADALRAACPRLRRLVLPPGLGAA